MELIGMAVGSIFLGNLADRIGRRPTIMLCLVVMSTGMFFAAHATGMVSMSVYRLYTGLGIGGMLASTDAMTAEFSNNKYRDLSVILMAGGFPVGVIIGGSIASALLSDYKLAFSVLFRFCGECRLPAYCLVWST